MGLFDTMGEAIDRDRIRSFNAVSIDGAAIDMRNAGVKSPGETWTYLINDDPFADKFEIKLIGDIGFSAGAGLYWPITVLYFLIKRLQKKSTPG